MNAQEFLHSETQIDDLFLPSIQEMFTRLAGISLCRKSFALPAEQKPRNFMIYTRGDYEAVIIMSADQDVYQSITEHMARRTDIQEEDIKVYVGEFFNILCGRIISSINRRYKVSALFGLPQMNSEKVKPEQAEDENKKHTFYFESSSGIVVIEIRLMQKEPV